MIYGGLFSHLIERLNQSMAPPAAPAGHLANVTEQIGLLDVPGFENLELNHWEQFCGNLSSEYLQLWFNEHFFSKTFEEYRVEQVPLGAEESRFLEEISFPDNADSLHMMALTINTLEARVNDTGNPDSDKRFVRRLEMTVIRDLQDHDARGTSKKSPFRRPDASHVLEFEIKHFAGPVKYTCDNWCHKNTHVVGGATLDCLSGSTNVIIHKAAEQLKFDNDKFAGVSKAGSARFREVLLEVTAELDQSRKLFVTCLLPNTSLTPNVFNAVQVYHQLNSRSLFEAAEMQQMGRRLVLSKGRGTFMEEDH